MPGLCVRACVLVASAIAAVAMLARPVTPYEEGNWRAAVSSCPAANCTHPIDPELPSPLPDRFRWLHIPKTGTSFAIVLYHYVCSGLEEGKRGCVCVRACVRACLLPSSNSSMPCSNAGFIRNCFVAYLPHPLLSFHPHTLLPSHARTHIHTHFLPLPSPPPLSPSHRPSLFLSFLNDSFAFG